MPGFSLALKWRRYFRYDAVLVNEKVLQTSRSTRPSVTVCSVTQPVPFQPWKVQLLGLRLSYPHPPSWAELHSRRYPLTTTGLAPKSRSTHDGSEPVFAHPER